ncbi:MAG: glutamyl-tRNA reductase [Candidatus Zixiibacteriota bacterium]
MLPCNWRLFVIGINHTTASLQDREPLQLTRDELVKANAALFKIQGIKESVVLSTCNRIEFYFVLDLKLNARTIVIDFYKKFKNIDISGIIDKFYLKKDKHTIDHIFRVASGIESMIVGENQILGQAKEAYSAACAANSAGKILHRLFHQAFRIGKQVRTDTELGQGACSVASATIDLVRSKIKKLDNPMILFIGLNKMITLAVSRLNRYGFDNFTFVNRTKEKAVEFAQQYKAEGHGLDSLPTLIPNADVIVSCTGSDKAVITADMLKNAFPANNGNPVLIADMAVPRDVEWHPSLTAVEYYDMEAVKEFVREKQNDRLNAIPQAERIIEYKLEQFVYWYDGMRHEPSYNGLSDAYERTRLHEMNKIYPELDDETRELVDRATKRLVNKLLHISSRSEKKADNGE